MLICGDSSDQLEILASLRKANNDDECRELELRSVEFDYDVASAIISLLRSKDWQTIHVCFCRGLVNDVVTACMSYHVSSFHIQSAANQNTMNVLAFGLNYSKSLSSLHLSAEMKSNECANFAKAFARNVSLQDLDLTGSTLDQYMLSHLGFAFRINRTIKSLVLDGCYIEDSQLASLLFALQDHPNLKRLSLQNNSCHEQSMSAISALLHYNDLEELNMNYLIRKKKIDEPVVHKEEEKFDESRNNESLEEASATEVEKEETKEEVENEEKVDTKTEERNLEPIKSKTEEEDSEPEPDDKNNINNKSLKVLQLAGNGLKDGFIESMLDIFGENNSLEELNLFGNCMTDRGIHLIIRKLSTFKRLRSLWLGHNYFSHTAQQSLLEAMRTNFVLEELNIRTLDNDPRLEAIQQQLDYHARLNRGGRRIFASDISFLPMGIWPLILERANQKYLSESTDNTLFIKASAADCIFCLLHGPALLDNPGIARAE